jgi:hypothetical protein
VPLLHPEIYSLSRDALTAWGQSNIISPVRSPQGRAQARAAGVVSDRTVSIPAYFWAQAGKARPSAPCEEVGALPLGQRHGIDKA